MEEQFLFTQIHEALDIPTPPGAFERLRTELTKKPVRPRPWPAFQMRNSTMGFRLAAGLTVVAIAVAAAAAVLAIHNSTNNSSPAGSRMSIQAYQKMIATDAPDPNRVWSAPCDETQHSGCESDATRSIPLIQKWYDDISRVEPPARFAVVNAEMRLHLAQSLSGLNALESDSKSNDSAAMTRDYIVAVYGEEWTSAVLPGIAASQQVSVATYTHHVSVNIKQGIESCNNCTLLTAADAKSCTTNGGVACLYLFDAVAGDFAADSTILVQYAAPDSLSAKDAVLQNDLAATDAVLLTMRLAVAANDQRGVNTAIDQLRRLEVQVDQDAAKITG